MMNESSWASVHTRLRALLGRSGSRAGWLCTSAAGTLGMMAIVASPLTRVQADGAQTEASRAKPPSATEGSREDGEAIYKRHGCNECHGAQGEGASSRSSAALRNAIVPMTMPFSTFVQRVREPRGSMPAFSSKQVSDEELKTVYSFLHSSPMREAPAVRVKTDPLNGQRVFALYGCSACHLSRGQGARSTGVRIGPPALPVSAFISYIRHPGGEMPPYTQKTVTDQELADMYAYLETTPPGPSWKTVPLLQP